MTIERRSRTGPRTEGTLESGGLVGAAQNKTSLKVHKKHNVRGFTKKWVPTD